MAEVEPRRPSPRVAPLLLAALRERRDALRAEADAPPDVRGRAPPPSDAEEALRLVMVRYHPRVRRGTCSDEDLRAYLDLLEALTGNAEGEDLRYLDAFNNAYEALVGLDWNARVRPARLAPFLARYRDLLDLHIGRLAPP